MKLVHNITISVFATEFEDIEAISEHLLHFLPENLENERLGVEVEDVRVQEGRNMKILKIFLEKQRHTKLCTERLKEMLGEKMCQLIAHDTTRIDDYGQLFLRLDKKKFVEEDEVVVVDHGECIHFKIMLACFPKNKERAILVAKELFS